MAAPVRRLAVAVVGDLPRPLCQLLRRQPAVVRRDRSHRDGPGTTPRVCAGADAPCLLRALAALCVTTRNEMCTRAAQVYGCALALTLVLAAIVTTVDPAYQVGSARAPPSRPPAQSAMGCQHAPACHLSHAIAQPLPHPAGRRDDRSLVHRHGLLQPVSQGRPALDEALRHVRQVRRWF